MIVLDVDRLKAVNDERGHHFGDEFLQLISQLVSLSLRDEDFVARVGGDEFAVLLPGADEAICEAVACRITTALEAHPGLAGWALAASMGHATTPLAESVTDAWRAADERMYQTKQQAA